MVPTQLGGTGSFIRLCVSYYPRQTASTFKEKTHRKLRANPAPPIELVWEAGGGRGRPLPRAGLSWGGLPCGTAAKASRATVLAGTRAATAPGPGPAGSHGQGHTQRMLHP